MSYEDNKKIGFIGLYRSLMNWEYVDDDAVLSCFIKLLLSVNYQEKNWQGQVVKRGSIVGSIDNLCLKLHMRRDKLKRCLNVLVESGVITVEVKPNKYHIITVTNYEMYQNPVGGKSANKTLNRTTNRNHNKSVNKADNRTTNKTVNNPTTTKKYNKENKENSGGVCPTGTHTPPQEKNKAAQTSVTPLGGEPSEPLSRREWRTYCESKGYDEYRAGEEWIKVGGVFTEEQKKKVREWLKKYGEKQAD